MFHVTYSGLVAAYLTLRVYHQENTVQNHCQNQPAQFKSSKVDTDYLIFPLLFRFCFFQLNLTLVRLVKSLNNEALSMSIVNQYVSVLC